MNKEKYVEPMLEVTFFANEDVITTSGGIELPDHEW